MNLGYNELGCYRTLFITNRFSGQIDHFTTQINPVITNPDYNEQKWPVPSLTVFKSCQSSQVKYSSQSCVFKCFFGFYSADLFPPMPTVSWRNIHWTITMSFVSPTSSLGTALSRPWAWPTWAAFAPVVETLETQGISFLDCRYKIIDPSPPTVMSLTDCPEMISFYNH